MAYIKSRQLTASSILGALVALLLVLPAQGEVNYKLKKGARGDICVSCHDEFEEVLKKKFLHTPLKKGDCTGCHNPHTSNYEMLLAAESGQLCYECHDEMIPEDAKSIHEVFLEGKCVSCHDPHATDNKNILNKAGSELCFECHKDFGKTIQSYDLKHDPVEEDCLECHNPHVSVESKNLLNDAVPSLCLECHETDKPMFKKAHFRYPVKTASCTSCHNPHGSNTTAILYDNVHEPVSEGKCDECHEGTSSSKPFALKDEGSKLCEGCHYEMVVDTFNKKRVHWPLADKLGCINCHAPHASPQDAILKAPMLELCGECHSDTIARQERSATEHPPIADGECYECHSPHSSDEIFLLNESSVIDLCENCHDWESHSEHPMGKRIIDPRRENITLQCLTCHRTHGTEYEYFIYFETTNSICVQCHDKYRR
jgi:DmsE family decaheme c-type cytochrome